MINKEIKNPLINTWESLKDLEKDYYLEVVNFKDNRLNKFEEYYKNMDSFERAILVLYAEYKSYRKVAEETEHSHQTIKLILNCIKQDIYKLNDK